MNPRAVQVSKMVASKLTPAQLAEYGNVLAPTYKSWQNNSMQYYTNLTNTYGVYPGAPTMFDFWVNGFSPVTGPIQNLSGPLNAGTNYVAGVYSAQALTGGSGTGATANITVTAGPSGGYVTSVQLVNPGNGYTVNDALSAALPGGTGFSVLVGVIAQPYTGGGEPQWAAVPARMNQQQVLPTNQGPTVNNPAAIQYSFIYPRPNNPVQPPIGNLS
jgi:hypothetical protein